MASELVEVELRRHDRKITTFTSSVDLEDAEDTQRLLEDAVTRDRHRDKQPNYAEYEIRIWRRQGGRRVDYVGRNK